MLGKGCWLIGQQLLSGFKAWLPVPLSGGKPPNLHFRLLQCNKQACVVSSIVTMRKNPNSCLEVVLMYPKFNCFFNTNCQKPSCKTFVSTFPKPPLKNQAQMIWTQGKVKTSTEVSDNVSVVVYCCLLWRLNIVHSLLQQCWMQNYLHCNVTWHSITSKKGQKRPCPLTWHVSITADRAGSNKYQ